MTRDNRTNGEACLVVVDQAGPRLENSLFLCLENLRLSRWHGAADFLTVRFYWGTSNSLRFIICLS